jgi:hypothetical protein
MPHLDIVHRQLLTQRKRHVIMSMPHLIIVGADKGGVGKTTISRAVMDYLKARNVKHAAFDTEHPDGNLHRFFPTLSTVVDLTNSDGQMMVFDHLADNEVTLIDVRAGLLSPSLKTLAETGFLEHVAANKLKITVLHVLGSTQASFDEIKQAADLMAGSRHILASNYINDSSYLGLSPEMRKVSNGEITIGKLDERAYEYVDASGLPFQTFIDTTQLPDGKPNSSVLRGYVRSWLVKTYQAFDSITLAS